MLRPISLFALALLLSSPATGWAALVVDPPRPITHRLNVRIIETALDDGSSPATVFGNAEQRAGIEAAVDAIWAQAGLDINFLDPVIRYNNSFAYQGLVPLRPTSDLNLMLAGAGQAGILHPDPSVISLFFVNVVPGFDLRSENWAGGSAKLSSSGVAQFVGDNLLTTTGGRESIATVVAHEIGHNLGLLHLADGSPNLMSPKRTTAQLNSQQIQAIFQSSFRSDFIAYIPEGGTGFPQLLPASMPGDYNRDGVVDTGDYTIWRDTFGSSSSLLADGNGNLQIDDGDYITWHDHFGFGLVPNALSGDYNRDGRVDAADYTTWRDTLGSTVALTADGNGNQIVDAQDYDVWETGFRSIVVSGQDPQHIPEPASCFLAAIVIAMISAARRRQPGLSA